MGVDGTAFAPGMTMSRAMLMTVLARLDGADLSGGAVWYEAGMRWAVANGISDGIAPDANISREQIAVMLYRYADKPAVSGDWLSSYFDKDAVSSWAKDALNWAASTGILEGYGGMLNPGGDATRAEVAVMVARYMNLLGR